LWKRFTESARSAFRRAEQDGRSREELRRGDHPVRGAPGRTDSAACRIPVELGADGRALRAEVEVRVPRTNGGETARARAERGVHAGDDLAYELRGRWTRTTSGLSTCGSDHGRGDSLGGGAAAGLAIEGERVSPTLRRLGPNISAAADEALADVLHAAALLQQFPESAAVHHAGARAKVEVLAELAGTVEEVQSADPAAPPLIPPVSRLDEVLEELRSDQQARLEIASPQAVVEELKVRAS